MIFTALCALAPLAALPQEDAATPETVLSLGFEGVDSLFVDAKDANFLNALKMLDVRLLELPNEIPDFDVPPPVLTLATRMLAGSQSLAVAIGTEPVPGLPIPALVDLRLGQGSEAAAQSINDDLTSFLGMMGMPFETPANGALMALPAPAPAWMGPVGSDFVVRLGSEAGLATPVVPALLPEGARVSFSGQMAYGHMLREMFALAELEAGSDPEFDMIKDMMGSMGLYELNYEWAAGTDAERQYMIMNIPGWASSMRDAGLLVEHGFGDDLLRTIPIDATWASAMSFDFQGLYNFYDEMMANFGVDLSELAGQAEAEMGLSIYDDILGAFGQDMVFYASDSTGGGGMMSMVGIVELRDRAKFLELAKIVGTLTNSFAASEADGYIRIGKENTAQGLNITLTFPGIPVPFELIIAVTEHYAVMGVTPQAVAVAVNQISAPTSSLLDNAAFLAQLPSGQSEFIGMHWIDTPRLMGDGFGAVSLATSALANAVRSPQDPMRQPGMLLPTLPELRKDAKGILMLNYTRGEDYLTEYRSDRSQLVNAAGVSGFLYNSPFLALLSFFMAAIPASVGSSSYAVAQAVDSAKVEVSEADIATIYTALELYAMDNNGVYPETLAELTVAGEDGASYLDADWDLLDPWGASYYYMPPYNEDDTPYVFSTSYDAAWEDGFGYEYDYDYDMYDDEGYVEYELEEPTEESDIK